MRQLYLIFCYNGETSVKNTMQKTNRKIDFFFRHHVHHLVTLTVQQYADSD